MRILGIIATTTGFAIQVHTGLLRAFSAPVAPQRP